MFDFNDEVAYQFGEIGPAVIDAWGAAVEGEVTLRECWGKPRLAFKAAIATGERNPGSTESHSHNPLFPRGNYFTEAGLLGPKNFFMRTPVFAFNPRLVGP
jgi:hypothetical protein